MLTEIKIRNTRKGNKPLKLTDSHGLYLEIRPSGKKLWRYRYRIDGKENVYALGEHIQALSRETEIERQTRMKQGRFTLAEARIERDKCRGLVKQGIHPKDNRNEQKAARIAEDANTFKVVAEEWLIPRRKKWAPRYLHQVERTLTIDAYPVIGDLPMRSITAAQLLEILRRIERRNAVTVAILLHQLFSSIFRYAVATLRADDDPAAALKGAIHRPKIQPRQKLDPKDIPDFIKALDSYGGERQTVIALKLLMLTFVRPGELIGAQWSEFNLDAAEWRIPAERMKMRETHIVPLAVQAIDLLRELHAFTGDHRYLFSNRNRPTEHMSSTTLNRALSLMGYLGRFSAHGFRATASTRLNEIGYRPDIIERQLAHKERNKARAAYNQALYLPERREMMQRYADLLDELANPETKVTPIRKAVN